MKKLLPLLLVITGILLAQNTPIEIYDFSNSQVQTTAKEILKMMNIAVKELENNIITTEVVQTDIVTITEYIKEDAWTDRPGWEKGRFFLTLTLNQLNDKQTELMIQANFERFGVPYELLLIPPAWTSVPSNGKLEEIICTAIKDRMSKTNIHLPEIKIESNASGNNQLPYFRPDPPFIPNVAVSNDPGTGNQNETSMGIFGGNFVCGGWNDNRTGIYHVGYAYSTDGGLNWSDDTIMIEPTYSEDGDPVICIDDSGTVYYFWLSFNRSNNSGDVFLTKSYDGGATWGPFVCVTPNSPTSLDDKPWANIYGDNILVSWYEYGLTGDLKFTRSTDRGATWSTGVSVGSGGNGTVPFLGTDSTVYVGWGFQDLKLNKSTDMGVTWQGQRVIIPVTWSPGSTPYRINNIPCFKTSNDRTKLYVVFADSRLGSGQLDVFFSKSTDAGENWSTPVKVNDTPSGDATRQFYPWMAVDPYDRIHVVWHDSRAPGNALAQYYSYSTDFGQTWSDNIRASDTAVVASTFIGDYTACAADSYHVYALWCDGRTAPSNPDVFFTKAMHQQNRDVGVAMILSPFARIPSGIPVNVEAAFRNFGLNQEIFPATALVTQNNDTVFFKDTTLTLDPAQVQSVLYGTFSPDSNLVYKAFFKTSMIGDENPLNDTASILARTTPDAGVTKIIRPRGKVIPDFPTEAEARIKNFSGDPKDVPATLYVKDTITGRIMFTKDTTVALGSGESLAVVFGQFTPVADSFYRTVCYTTLAGDDDPANDTAKAISFARLGSLPDSFGYVYESTQEGDTVTFSWIDYTGGTQLSGWVPSADDGIVSRVLPFGFKFYAPGVPPNITQINVCTNGFLETSTMNTYQNIALPAGTIQNLIAPFWDDLTLTSQGAVYEKTGTDNSYVVYSWVGVPRYGTSELQTFQVVLYRDNKIRYNYLDVNGDRSSNTIGIQGGYGAHGWFQQYVFDGSPANHIVTDSTTLVFSCDRVVGVGEYTKTEITNSTILYAVKPNPVKGNARISFALGKKGMVSVNIYDATGRLFRNLVNKPHDIGNYTLTWDGKDDQGVEVMSGIYFYSIKTNDYKATKKLVLMR
jgi:hypothetical protein